MYCLEEEMYFMMHVEQIVRVEQTDILTSDWAMITKEIVCPASKMPTLCGSVCQHHRRSKNAHPQLTMVLPRGLPWYLAQGQQKNKHPDQKPPN